MDHTNATYHRINARWITDDVLKKWVHALGLELAVVQAAQKRLRIASHHFRHKYFRSVRIAPAFYHMRGPTSRATDSILVTLSTKASDDGSTLKRRFIPVAEHMTVGVPIPNIAMDTISAARLRPLPAARAAGAEATGRAVAMHQRSEIACTTRAMNTQVASKPALYSAVQTSGAEIVQAVAQGQEPKADIAMSKKLAADAKAGRKADLKQSRATAKGRAASKPKPPPKVPTDQKPAWLPGAARLSFAMMVTDPKVQAAVPNLTGMPGAESCIAFYDYLNRGDAKRADNLPLYNYRGDGQRQGRGQHAVPGQTKKARPGSRKLTGPDAFFMTLIMLHKGLDLPFVELLFGVDERTLAPYYISWVLFLEQELKSMMEFPSQEQVEAAAPPEWLHVYGRIPRVVWDATELVMESPGEIETYRACWSTYKHRTTAKILGGVTPAGAFVYASDPFPGRIS